LGFDRYAYVNNSPTNFNDPTGFDVGCSAANQDCLDSNGLTKKSQEKMKAAVSRGLRSHVYTNSIWLNGGGRPTSYGTAAEEGWTGFEGSGESLNPRTAGRVNIFEPINLGLTLLRDNTNTRDILNTSNPDVSGQVYYGLADNGWGITGVSITNTSFEGIAVNSVFATEYSVFGDNTLSYGQLYPYSYPSLVSVGYGLTQPGTTSDIIRVDSGVIPNWNYVNVSIGITSESGRYGRLSVSMSVNPPKR
jgi:hypothetical protein